MNSLDLYDFDVPVVSESKPTNIEESSSSFSSTTTTTPTPRLNDEVTQVFGQLGRFWGGVRKQSQSAFESARKDFGDVVSQAQKELGKLATVPNNESSGSVLSEAPDENPVENSKASMDNVSETTISSSTSTQVSSSESFLSRLQGSLPPNLTPTALSSTLQRHLPDNLQQGLHLDNATANFAQLRATLTENIQRVQQGTTVQQAERLAEQYMSRGEAFLKEAGEFLKDAVKVVPPEEADNTPGVLWDGTDVWPLQTSLTSGPSRKGKDKESNVIFSIPRAAGKRADALLRKLRSNPEDVRKDPDSDEDGALRDMWTYFLHDVETNGGTSGEVWNKRISDALDGHDTDEDIKALTSLRDELVPAEMTTETFWTRYFFRVHQIEREEEKRKALVAATGDDEDDFTWEDEEDEGLLSTSRDENATPITTRPSATPTSAAFESKAERQIEQLPVPISTPSSTSQTPVCVSPRESEDSYDVVSSGNVSSTGGRGSESKGKGQSKNEDGDDSDWE
ncbi:hypothetical protein BU17DRAFT_35641 [Hysterangium stoloniferum]|nr:hypothetical protein BU17DRAFT_35641 [Hysterangium stoloniferum]